MSLALETKACVACAMAKRRCGKQTPHCQRCRTRGIDCRYPPPKPTSFILCGGDDPLPVEHEELPYDSSQLSARSPELQSIESEDARLYQGLDLTSLSSDLVGNQLVSNWFTSIETWNIDRFPQAEQQPICTVDFKRYLTKFRQWLAQWTEEGSNPFIHFRMYRNRFPRCIQDAYTVLTAYIHKTEANEQIVFKIIEDRSKQLLLYNGIPSPHPSVEKIRTGANALDSLEHIARVQALLIYQVLGLYDGDIRLRYLAESNIPVLNSWMHQMVEHASQDACLGESIIFSTHEQVTAGFSLSDIAHGENLLWYSWILAESIRRTWLLASGIQGMYIIQQGLSIPCLGGMMFTTRQGVWEAQSAVAWEKLCSEVNVGFIQRAEAYKLFAEATPDEVNDFSKYILEITFGIENMERWGVKVQD